MSCWHTSAMTSMDEMFMDEDEFNADISKWDVSRVTDTVYSEPPFPRAATR